MDPIEALKAIRILLRPAKELDDADAFRKIMREVNAILDKALTKNPRS